MHLGAGISLRLSLIELEQHRKKKKKTRAKHEQGMDTREGKTVRQHLERRQTAGARWMIL